MNPVHHDAALHPIRLYIGVFVFLTVVTVIEMFPLFGLWNIPAVVLILLSVMKFVTVCYVFMHLMGDAPILKRVFFLPLVMVVLIVGSLMSLFQTWSLPKLQGGVTEHEVVRARYRPAWEGACSSWLRSAKSGNEYCASPPMAFSTDAAYAALQGAGVDPRLAGLEGKSPEERKAALVAVGQEVYGKQCAACHGGEGQGVAKTFPPLKGDRVVAGPAEEHVRIVLEGMVGVPIDGVTYNGAMPGWSQLTDEEIAAVVTFERNAWGHDGGVVEPAQVKAAR